MQEAIGSLAREVERAWQGATCQPLSDAAASTVFEVGALIQHLSVLGVPLEKARRIRAAWSDLVPVLASMVDRRARQPLGDASAAQGGVNEGPIDIHDGALPFVFRHALMAFDDADKTL